ncbi:hypothetical protein PROFUN_02029 [Planoprotostelium fungivorum]|uniref:DUF1279 domain-containing protein n=1 Tax=Planoprotostelium fungivorum TaxID=1890364 RepID=A0A2P6NB65_9EUKA|nr:hypothetical protein PROFUN_02029 [Planoprotostelium fungivorum]
MPEGENVGLRTRLKNLFIQYGKIAFAVHIASSVITFFILLVLLMFGVDVASLLKMIGVEAQEGSSGSLLATAAAALVMTMMTSFPRMILTIAITPAIAQRLGYKKSEDKKQ